jgi:hypothetical protein
MPIDTGMFEDVLTGAVVGLMEKIVGVFAATSSSVGVVLLPPGPGLLTEI